MDKQSMWHSNSSVFKWHGIEIDRRKKDHIHIVPAIKALVTNSLLHWSFISLGCEMVNPNVY